MGKQNYYPISLITLQQVLQSRTYLSRDPHRPSLIEEEC